MPDLELHPASESIRCRHVLKDDIHYYILFNEEKRDVVTKPEFLVKGKYEWLDAKSGEIKSYKTGAAVHFAPYDLKIMRITPEN